MKKVFLCLAILALAVYLGWLPFRATDVAELLPAKTVIITRSGDQYIIDIGAGVKAVGRTLKDALSALKQEASGEVFFQTAEQVIVTDAAAQVIPEVAAEEAFRPAAELYLTAEENLDAEEVSDYLTSHHSGRTISRVKAALAEGEPAGLPVLEKRDGGYRILG